MRRPESQKGENVFSQQARVVRRFNQQPDVRLFPLALRIGILVVGAVGAWLAVGYAVSLLLHH